MTAETTTAKRLRCPSCDKKAKQVSPVTLRALLRDKFSAEIGSGDHSCCDSNGEGCTPITEDTGWRFCDSPDCDVVYFSEEGNKQFTKAQLKVPVGVKETSGERPLCYCFGHSVSSIKVELRTQGRSDALEDIRAKMSDPGCHCETANPSGSCCLGSVTKGIQIARKELEVTESNRTPESTAKLSTGRGEKIAKVGTIISAIMASACCWLPLLLLAVGVSGAGIAATLEAYRPLFMIVTFGFLGAAFYFTYRSKKAAADSESDCCSTARDNSADCCEPIATRRFSMMALNKVMLWVVTVLAIAFLQFPRYVGAWLGTGHDGTITETMKAAMFKIDGMTCEGCASIAEKAIRNVPGILAVEVDYETGQAVVGTDECCPIPQDEIIEALQAAGYEAQPMEDDRS